MGCAQYLECTTHFFVLIRQQQIIRRAAAKKPPHSLGEADNQPLHLQHDLKGRMPERSEWLVAGGAAKRNPRYRDAHRDAFEKREYRIPRRLFSRPPDAFL